MLFRSLICWSYASCSAQPFPLKIALTWFRLSQQPIKKIDKEKPTRCHCYRRLVFPTFTTMCGRYDNLIPRDAYSALFRAVRVPRSNFPPRYNIAPTDQIPIVRIDPRDGDRELTMARWGLIPFWMKEKPKAPHINARAETVHIFSQSLRGS